MEYVLEKEKIIENISLKDKSHLFVHLPIYTTQ